MYYRPSYTDNDNILSPPSILNSPEWPSDGAPSPSPSVPTLNEPDEEQLRDDISSLANFSHQGSSSSRNSVLTLSPFDNRLSTPTLNELPSSWVPGSGIDDSAPPVQRPTTHTSYPSHFLASTEEGDHLLQPLPPPQPMIRTPVVAAPFAPINDIPLTRLLLRIVLKDLSERLYRSFQRQVRLVVHGGAVIVLHPSFTYTDRASTQDINYIHRGFAAEYRELGFTDAEQRLRTCIAETTANFNLGVDWMNDNADVVLPWALECVLPFAYLIKNLINMASPPPVSSAGSTTRYLRRRYGKRTRNPRRYLTSADSRSSQSPGPGHYR